MLCRIAMYDTITRKNISNKSPVYQAPDPQGIFLFVFTVSANPGHQVSQGHVHYPQAAYGGAQGYLSGCLSRGFADDAGGLAIWALLHGFVWYFPGLEQCGRFQRCSPGSSPPEPTPAPRRLSPAPASWCRRVSAERGWQRRQSPPAASPDDFM